MTPFAGSHFHSKSPIYRWCMVKFRPNGSINYKQRCSYGHIADGLSNFVFTNGISGFAAHCLHQTFGFIIIQLSVLLVPALFVEDVTTTLSPTTGGHWVSSNSAIATVNDSGIATGISGEMQDLLLRKLLRLFVFSLLAGSLWLISRHCPERA